MHEMQWMCSAGLTCKEHAAVGGLVKGSLVLSLAAGVRCVAAASVSGVAGSWLVAAVGIA